MVQKPSRFTFLFSSVRPVIVIDVVVVLLVAFGLVIGGIPGDYPTKKEDSLILLLFNTLPI